MWSWMRIFNKLPSNRNFSCDQMRQASLEKNASLEQSFLIDSTDSTKTLKNKRTKASLHTHTYTYTYTHTHTCCSESTDSFSCLSATNVATDCSCTVRVHFASETVPNSPIASCLIACKLACGIWSRFVSVTCVIVACWLHGCMYVCVCVCVCGRVFKE